MLLSIIVITISLMVINNIYKEYKKCETIDEKVVIIIIIIVFLTPIIIYYLDRYNVISNLGLFENSNPERWFSFIETYISSLISAIIGAVVLVLMTIRQLNLERDRNLLDKRIENAPIFRYEIDNRIVNTPYEYIIYNNIDGNPYDLTLKVENLGLNHAKNIEFEIYDDVNNIDQKYKFDTQSFLKKDGFKYVRFVFNYKYDSKIQKNNNKQIKIIVKYQDLLNNDYIQNIKVCVEIPKKRDSAFGGNLYIVSKTIENELYLKKE